MLPSLLQMNSMCIGNAPMIKVRCKHCGMIHIASAKSKSIYCGCCKQMIQVPTGYHVETTDE
jgi:hypothetical protein